MGDGDRTIGRVIDDLEGIVSRARADYSEIGIFPAMYRSVTIAIDNGINHGHFDDPEMIERLAVVFADRYLDAHHTWSIGRAPTESWRVAFDAATDGKRRSAAQHLLAGMNAHINLDLGIAAWEVSPDDPACLRDDFNRVNDILFDRLDANQEALASVSRRMTMLDRLAGKLDERAMGMAIAEARDRAWDLTESLAAARADADTLVTDRDHATAAIGSAILGDSLAIRIASSFVARTEGRTVVDVIDAFVASAPA